jgi:hypothetical protein
VTDCICGNGQYLATGGSATAKAVFVNSVLQHNRAVKSSSGAVSGIMFANCNLVNVSVLDNSFSSATYGDCGFNAYNSVIFASGMMSDKCVCEQSVTGDGVRSVMATLVFDPRVIAGSEAETMGLAGHLADKVELPQGVDRYVDFFGNVIAQSGTVMAGAVQQTATPAAGAVVAKASVSVDGNPTARASGYSYVIPDCYPTQYLFSVPPVAGKRVCYYGFSQCSSRRGVHGSHTWTVRFPAKDDDSLWVMPPADIGTAITNSSVTLGVKTLIDVPDDEFLILSFGHCNFDIHQTYHWFSEINESSETFRFYSLRCIIRYQEKNQIRSFCCFVRNVLVIFSTKSTLPGNVCYLHIFQDVSSDITSCSLSPFSDRCTVSVCKDLHQS